MSLPTVDVLGVRVTDATKQEAIALLERWIASRDGRSRSVYIANAHTLNTAWEDSAYRDVLNSADVVFGDGTGVRLAARWAGVRLKDNLVGTDLLPQFFTATRGKGYSCFLLGATPETVVRAAGRLREDFPYLEIAGYHHGYVQGDRAPAAVEMVNASQPDLLLVAMGNPLQEQWIHDHQHRLRVPVVIGVGGLFDHWAGNLHRAPQWVRRAGIEWVQILLQQPHKWRRYLLGNPKFVYRALRGVRVGGVPR